MLRELEIRSTEDLILVREVVRELARTAGCDPVIETRLVAGLSDLAERFYRGACGRILVRREGGVLEAILEHCLDGIPQDPHGAHDVRGDAQQAGVFPDSEGLLLAIGSVRYMWDEVDVRPAVSQGLKVVLRSWLK